MSETATVYQSSPVQPRTRRTRAETAALRDTIVAVLADHHPMTVRQVYYQLVARQVIANNRGQYQAVSALLVELRKGGAVPWSWLEDRNRRPRAVAMWDNAEAIVRDALAGYRRNVWADQPAYVECWLEKDALSGIFEETLAPYGVTLNVGRGFDGWDSIRNAATRYAAWAEEGVTVLYFGDFDPSGEDMVRSLRERLDYFAHERGVRAPTIVKCALTPEDVRRYHLPTDFTKATDSRRAGFVAKYGDVSVELDALPVGVLRARLIEAVEAHLDLDALAATRRAEAADRAQLRALLGHDRGQEPADAGEIL